MKVLHISAQKPDSTGSGIYLSELIKGMKSFCSKQVLIAGIDKKDSEEAVLEKFNNEVEFFPVKYNTKELDFNVPGMSNNMPYPSTRYMDMDDEMARKMKKAIRAKLSEVMERFNPDIVLCHHLYFATSIVREMLPETKVVGISHGTCIRQLMNNDFQKEYILSQIKNLDKIFSLHAEQKRIIENLFNIKESKVRVLGSGYNEDIFKIKNIEKPKDKIKISYAGKLSFSKGLVSFIKSLEELPYSSEKLSLVFCGDGSEKDEVEYIKDLAGKSKYEIEFTGRINQSELSEVLNSSDIFVLPSFYEGLPLVILEAMACGNMVVSTDLDGVSEWLGDEINSSGLMKYVELPEMEAVSKPKKEALPRFEKELSNVLKEAIEYRLSHKDDKVDISYLNWDGLAKTLYNFLEEVCK